MRRTDYSGDGFIPDGESKYTVTEAGHGFRVEGKNRTPVWVELYDNGMEFKIHRRENGHLYVPLFHYYELSKAVGIGLMQDWQPKGCEGKEGKAEKLRQWAYKQAAAAVGARVHAEWKRLLALANPDVVAVQRRSFAALGHVSQISACRETYEFPHLVDDLKKYRAAHHPCDGLWTSSDKIREVAENWRGMLSDTGQPYRSLNLTLDHLPGGVPSGMVQRLKFVHLHRPIYDRVELVATCAAARALGEQWVRPDNLPVYLNATRAQILRACAMYYEHQRTPFRSRRCAPIYDALMISMDYPLPHKGNVVGLMEKSIVWHREQAAEDARKQQEEANLTREQLVAAPPLPLPTAEGIRFLDTVGAVLDEGEAMGHCIGTYAVSAYRGECFLFHVEHKGARASVAVSSGGYVAQALGPGNVRNAASAYAQKQLEVWAMLLRTPSAPVRWEIVPQ